MGWEDSTLLYSRPFIIFSALSSPPLFNQENRVNKFLGNLWSSDHSVAEVFCLRCSLYSS